MRGALHHPARTFLRLTAFLAINGTGVIDHFVRLRTRGRGEDPRSCAQWLTTWSRRTLRGLGIDCEYTGRIPNHGLVVCNHLSYLDIPVLAGAGPMVFVSKADVARWPLLGSLARCGGTLFLQRESRGHVAVVADALRPRVEGGTVVTLFPEGTSSGGESILPFRSSLLEPAAANNWPVTPAWIHYHLADGLVSEEVAYWRDMVFLPHFLNLLGRGRLTARVAFGDPVQGVRDRKELTRRLHAEVVRLMERERPSPAPIPLPG